MLSISNDRALKDEIAHFYFIHEKDNNTNSF